MPTDVEQCVDVLAMEFCNKSADEIAGVLRKCIYEDPYSYGAIRLLAIMSQV